MYAVKEIFHTLQGEGANAGRAAVFCRLAGCNLWSGREADRAAAQCRFCDTDFVGLDGPGGGRFATADELARACAAALEGAENLAPRATISASFPLRREPRLAATPNRPGGLGRRLRGDDVGGEHGESRTGKGREDSSRATPPTVRTLLVLTGGEPMLQVDAPLIDALHAQGFEIAIETNGTLPVPGAIDWICVSPKAAAPFVQQTGDELKLVYPQEGLAPENVAGHGFTHRFLQPMDGPDRVRNTALAVAYCKAHPEWRLSVQMHKVIGIP